MIRAMAALVLCCPTAPAHGGQYRGPGDLVPARGAQNIAQPAGVGADLSRWQFWWEFNKEPLLERTLARRGLLRRALPRAVVDDVIVPALGRALADPAAGRDIRSACMLALAKTGRCSKLADRLCPFLKSLDQETRETAVLAHGVGGLAAAVPELTAIAMDTEEGRALVGSRNDIRVRSFACYALGLIGAHRTDLASRRRIFTAMRWILQEQPDVGLDVQVAAVQALRLLRPARTEAGDRLRQRAAAFLLDGIGDEAQDPLVRAHMCTAVAELARSGRSRDEARAQMLAMLEDRGQPQWLQQAALLALPALAGRADSTMRDALHEVAERGRQLQARFFAPIAIGWVGSREDRAYLADALQKAPPVSRPWEALGLALAGLRLPKAERKEVGRVLQAAFDRTKHPIRQAGIGIALGILGDEGAAETLRTSLRARRNVDEAEAYLATALAMLGHEPAREDILRLLARSLRRPTLFVGCVTALSLLGGTETAPDLVALVALLPASNTVTMLSATARAIGRTRDATVVPDLVALLQNPERQNLQRAFAAVALGDLASPATLPCASRIAVGLNYRAAVRTLLGTTGNGVLDLR